MSSERINVVNVYLEFYTSLFRDTTKCGVEGICRSDCNVTDPHFVTFFSSLQQSATVTLT